MRFRCAITPFSSPKMACTGYIDSHACWRYVTQADKGTLPLVE